MRPPLVLLLAMATGSACAAKAGKSEVSAFPTLSSLHHDPAKRADQLDSANQRPGAEQNANKTDKQLQVETVAATAAAIIGSLFSSSPNVVVGSRTPFDENQLLLAPGTAAKSKNPESEKSEESEAPPPGSCLLLLSTRPASCDDKSSLRQGD